MSDQVKELGEKIASYQKSVAEAQDAATKESKKHDGLIAAVEEKA